jgi:transposase-like protein
MKKQKNSICCIWRPMLFWRFLNLLPSFILLISHFKTCFHTIMGYSDEEKLEIVRLYYSHNRNIERVRQEFRQIFPRRRVPSTNTVKNIIKHFIERKTVTRKKRVVLRNADEDLNILLYFEGKLKICFLLM